MHSPYARPCCLLLLFETEETPLLSEFHFALLLGFRPELEFRRRAPSSESYSSNAFPGSSHLRLPPLKRKEIIAAAIMAVVLLKLTGVQREGGQLCQGGVRLPRLSLSV